MAILPIRTLPDPVLRQRTRRVNGLDSSLERLIEDMIETMRDAHGVGLAANQVGVPLRLCVIEIPEEDEEEEPGIRVLINPTISVRQGERELIEGCLSIPGYRGQAKRSHRVRVRALDRKGNPIRIKAENDLLAQALEHELGHLNGELYIDHLVTTESIWKIGEEPSEDDEPTQETASDPEAATEPATSS